jgi:hypothetical protein
MALAQLVHDELTSFGTGGGGRLGNPDMTLALRALRAVLTRLGVDFELPLRDARTSQDHRAVGTHCVGVLKALCRTAYHPDRHLRPAEEVPPADNTRCAWAA